MWCEAWLYQRTTWLVLKVPAINPQTLVLSRRAHFILVKDASSLSYSSGTAGASSTWQSRSQPLRRGSPAVAPIHCLSRETGPVGDIQGLSWVPPFRLFLEGLIGRGRMMSEEGTLWWDIMILLSPPSSPQPFLSYITLLPSCSFTFRSSLLVCCFLVFTVFLFVFNVTLVHVCGLAHSIFFSKCSDRKKQPTLFGITEIHHLIITNTCWRIRRLLDKCLSTYKRWTDWEVRR